LKDSDAGDRALYPGIENPGLLPKVVDHRHVDTECEVLVYVDDEEVWFFGVIAEWRRHEDGSWTAWVRWAAPSGNRIDIIRPDRLRPVQTDWSRGRRPPPPIPPAAPEV
jgi:hypothetical protein